MPDQNHLRRDARRVCGGFLFLSRQSLALTSPTWGHLELAAAARASPGRN